MSNLSKYLTEAENAPMSYPDLYKPKEVWKIREDNSSYYGRPDNGYLSASFVLEKNLKWPDLGFNLTVQVMNGGRSLIFLTKEDADEFLNLAEANYPQLSNYGLVVAHGRGGDELVRINNSKINIPIYLAKGSIEWLSNLEDTKVPQEIRDRLKGEVQVSDAQKEKEEREEANKQKALNFNEQLINAVKMIDPNVELSLQYGRIIASFIKDNCIASIEPKDGDQLRITTVLFPHVDFGDYAQVEELSQCLMPDKETRDKLGWYNSCTIEDQNHKRIFYPRLTLRKTWNAVRINIEINHYLDTIIKIVNGYNNLEEFE